MSPPSKREKPVKKNLNVSLRAGELVTKIATHRGLTIEEFFEEKDVTEFFTHLLLAEMKKEAQRLQNRN